MPINVVRSLSEVRDREQLASIANLLQVEFEYYIDTATEQREIIEQLTGTGSPKGYIYIHPFDLAELFDKHWTNEVDVVITKNSGEPNDGLIYIDGKVYKQSPNIPAVTKRFV